MTIPILIAGAGPTGLVLALWLTRSGVPVRITERRPGPGEASRAMVVHARTLEFYDQLGVADQVVSQGIQIDTIHLWRGKRNIAAFNFGDLGRGLSPYPFVLSFPQDDHERLLVRALNDAGVNVDWNTELTAFTNEPDHVRATLKTPSGESQLDAAYLCGCDGASSTVRHLLNLAFPGGTYEHAFYVADTEAQGPAVNGQVNVSLTGDVFHLVFPLRRPGMVRLIGIVPDSLEHRDVTFDDVRAEIESSVDLAVKSVNWFSTYRVHHRVADSFRRGRVFLAGDAGHVHSPVGGQGMNTGIGDAVNLAWKLAAVLKGQLRTAVLDTYEPERITFARSLVATTDRLFQAIVGHSVDSHLVRGLVFPYLAPAILSFRSARRAQFRLISQTRIHYRDSPLSQGRSGRIHAGDRLPWLETPDNYASLSPDTWQLHTYGPMPPDAKSYALHANLEPHEFPHTPAARRAGFTQNTLYLIRPDGHIALTTDAADLSPLRQYHSQFFC